MTLFRNAVFVAAAAGLLAGIILAALRAGAADVEDLGRTTRLSPRDFATALSSLELTGRIHVSATGAVRTV